MIELVISEAVRIEIAKLELQPGDSLVLKTDKVLTMEQVARIREQMKGIAPGHEIIVLTSGFSIEILRTLKDNKND